MQTRYSLSLTHQMPKNLVSLGDCGHALKMFTTVIYNTFSEFEVWFYSKNEYKQNYFALKEILHILCYAC